jgi:hypothetical protein
MTAIAAIGKASTDTLMPSPERWAAAKIVRDYLFELRGRMEAAVADVGTAKVSGGDNGN